MSYLDEEEWSFHIHGECAIEISLCCAFQILVTKVIIMLVNRDIHDARHTGGKEGAEGFKIETNLPLTVKHQRLR